MESIISYFLCFIVEAIIVVQYASHLFNAKRTSGNRLTTLCALYTILFIVSLFNNRPINMLLYLTANCIFLSTQYEVNYRFALFHSVLLSAVMGMCELIIYYMIERFTPRFFAQMDQFYNTIIFILCSKLLFFAIIYLLTHILKNPKKKNQHYDNMFLLLIFIPATAIFIMLTFVSLSDHYLLDPNFNWLICLCGLFLLIANLLVFGVYQYTQTKSLEYTEMQLLLQKECALTDYYKMLHSQSENQSILIHDIKKHLQSIEMLNEEKDHEKISLYIQQLLLSSELKERSRICDRELLNAILSRYQRICSERNITFHADIRKGTTDFLSDSDLTPLFCNLLENALEAIRSIENPYIEISTSKREHAPFVLLTVINSCRINPFSNHNESLQTTKPDKRNHGFGLKSIRKIVEKYEGEIQMYYHEETLTFHTVITLKRIS